LIEKSGGGKGRKRRGNVTKTRMMGMQKTKIGRREMELGGNERGKIGNGGGWSEITGEGAPSDVTKCDFHEDWKAAG
jgi:hypothetical protein